MFLIDSHCHLDYEPMTSDISGTLKRAKDQGVKGFLTIGTDLSKIPVVTALTENNAEVFATIGVHPHESAKTQPPGELLKILIEEANHPKIVGFGETGLDYYYIHSPQHTQHEAFKAHIEAALICDLPLIIHSREAEEDTIFLLETFGQQKVRGVMHCFGGSPWLRDRALELGFYISVSGILTFKNAENLRRVIKDVPLDRLLVETDSPYLSPEPHRGRPNEPAHVVEVAKALADLKGMHFEKLCTQTTENFLTLFSKANLSCV